MEIRQKKGYIDKDVFLLAVEDPKEGSGSGGATINALLTVAEYISAQRGYSVSHMERCGAVVKRRTRDRFPLPGSIPTNSKCCFLEQETLSTLLSTGFYPGKRGPHGRLVLDY